MTDRELFNACKEKGLFRVATNLACTMPVMEFMETVASLASNPLEEVKEIPTEIQPYSNAGLFTKEAFELGQIVWRLQLPEGSYMLFSEGDKRNFHEDGLPSFPVDVVRIVKGQHRCVAGSLTFSFNAIMKSIH